MESIDPFARRRRTAVAPRNERNPLQEGAERQSRPRHRRAIDFSVEGDLRYLSHQETLRLLARGLTRAELPVSRTEGFNPRARISLPLPRPVGVASRTERALVDFTEPVPAARLVERLGSRLPAGIRVQNASVLDPGDRSVPRGVRYRVVLDGGDRAALARRAKELLRFAPIPYERYVHKTGRHRRIDLRPYMETIEVKENEVRFTLHVTGGGSIKPAEVCEILGIGRGAVNHLIERTEIVWQASRGVRR